MQLTCALVLLAAAGMLADSYDERGCATWDLHRDGKDEVCCSVCHPGKFLVQKCGKDPKELCKPCKSGTFAVGSGTDACRECTKCTEFQREETPCTSTHDRVCVCMNGYRCSDPQCSICELHCSQGQELVGGSCLPCPPGSFQNGTQRKCVPWRKECPHPDQYVVIKGSAAHDVICGPVSQAHYGWMIATLFISTTLIILAMVACVLHSYMRMKKPYEQQFPEKHGPDVSRAERGPVQENCCFPQQEQGSDLSLDSQDSEKLARYPCLLGAESV
ncbi:tumor necrosis factor receptor superfamily member 5-like [Arapaima gigas]